VQGQVTLIQGGHVTPSQSRQPTALYKKLPGDAKKDSPQRFCELSDVEVFVTLLGLGLVEPLHPAFDQPEWQDRENEVAAHAQDHAP
jgi:hypothetical protein